MMGNTFAMSDGQHNYGAIALLRRTLRRAYTVSIGPSAQELPAAMTPGLELVMPPFSAATQETSTPCAALLALWFSQG